MSLFRKKQDLESHDGAETENAAAAPAAADPGEVQMPLLTGASSASDMPQIGDVDASSSGGHGFGGPVLIVLVVVIAAGSLFAMRLGPVDVSIAKGAKDVEAKIEQALAKLAKPESMPGADPLNKTSMDALFQDTQAIVAMFSSDPTKRQVPIEYLQKNPFELPTVAASDAPQVIGVAVRDDNTEQRKLKLELKGLELQSVMDGRYPVAIISGEMVKTGQKVGSFTVKSITGRTVELEASGLVFSLEMEENPNGIKGTGKRRK